MAYGQKAFRRSQISNPENTPGTGEAATEVLFGVWTQNYADETWHKPDQDRGVLALNVETPFELQKEIELEFEGELYDRLAVFIMSNAIRGNVTATQPDNINEPLHYLWTFAPSLTSPNTPDETNGIDTFTLEYGDNVQAYEADYCFTLEVTIEGTVNEPINVTWRVKGQEITETTFTPALVAPTAKYFPFDCAKFYIDTTFAGIGTTLKTGMLRAFTWTFETMFTARYAADGTCSFSTLNEARKTAVLEMTYYRDGTNSEAEKDKWEAQTLFFPRIRLESSGEMDVGQSNPPYINLDGAYRYTEWPETEEEDGTAVVTVTAEAFYDTTSAKMIEVQVGTTMSAFAV